MPEPDWTEEVRLESLTYEVFLVLAGNFSAVREENFACGGFSYRLKRFGCLETGTGSRIDEYSAGSRVPVPVSG